MATPAQLCPRSGPAEDRITDTASHTGEWAALLANGSDVTFTELISRSMTLNGANIDDAGQSHAGMVLSKGLVIRGIFTTIQRASGGEVIAFKPPFPASGF